MAKIDKKSTKSLAGHLGRSASMASRKPLGGDDFAIVKTGGNQYLVSTGDEIVIDRVKDKKGKELKKGSKFILETLFSNKKGRLNIGNPVLKTGVKAEVIEEIKDEKIVVFKYRPKKRYRKKTGFRARKTKVKILSI